MKIAIKTIEMAPKNPPVVLGLLFGFFKAWNK